MAYITDRGLLFQEKGKGKPKKVLIQIGINFFELYYWGKLKGKTKEEHAKDIIKLLKDDRYSVKLIKEEE